MAWQRYLWLAVPALGLFELGAHFLFAARAPSPPQWREARAPLEALRRPGDLVVVAPSWADPEARYAFGEKLMPLGDVARPDATAYARAIEVSILGQRSLELGGWKEVGRQSHGSFEFRVVENPLSPRVRFDFVEKLGPETVEVFERAGAGSELCAWTANGRVSSGWLFSPPTFPARRFECKGGEAFFVGVTVIDDEAYRPRRCIWALPTPSGPLRIRFREVPLGRVLRGYGALPWFMMRDVSRVPVELSVRIAGERIGTFVHRMGEGWKKFEFSCGAHAGQTKDVEFEVKSDQVSNQHFCFQADTR